MLESGPLSDPAVKAALSGFTRLVIDHSARDQGEALGEWEVRGLPSLVFVSPDGEIAGTLPGVHSPQKIIALASRASEN